MNHLVQRLRALFSGKLAERDIEDELAFHLEMETRKNIAAGMSPKEAARAARLQFGTDPTAVKDYVRDARGIGFLETLFQDIRYAFRGFRRTPLFAVTVIATIAIGLGWNTAAFTIFNAMLLRPIDALEPHSLYWFGWQNANGDPARLSWGELDELRTAHPGLSAVTATVPEHTRLDGRFATCVLVDGEYFRMLGINARLGRTLLPVDDHSPDSSPTAVLSYTAWNSRYGGAADILGRKVLIQGRPFVVVGVMPEPFTGVRHGLTDVWVSLSNIGQFEDLPKAFVPSEPAPIMLAGRLSPGVSEAQARTALTTWMQGMEPEKSPHAGLTSLATLVPFNPRVIAALTPLGIVFFLVLLSACANVANMLLARAMSRQREIGVRLSLGAARGRLIRQLLTESVLLAIPSAAAAFAISQAFIDIGVHICMATIPPSFLDKAELPPMAPDSHVFWFMIGAAVLVALLFGLVPALQATRLNVMQAARGDFSSEFRPSRLRNALVIAQVTVCGFLLICCGVFLRRTTHLESLDPGVRTRDVLEIDVQPKSRARDLAILQAHPAIEMLASSSDPPFDTILPFIAASGASEAGLAHIAYRYASPDYFTSLDIPVTRGRSFSAEEGHSEAAVVVLSESAARKLWPHQDALGQTLSLTLSTGPVRGNRTPRYRTMQVIGIVRDSAVESIDNPDRSCLFFPSRLEDPRNYLLARVNGEPQQAIRALDTALEQNDPGSVQEINVLKVYVNAAIWSYRLEDWISEGLGGIALLLTLSGIYGVLSYIVAQRTKEIGIRLAIGARASTVRKLILGQCLRLAGLGIGIGVVLALAVARVLSAIFSEVSSQVFNVVAYSGGIAVVLAACLAAAFFPARRAARVDPITTLRYD